MPAKCSLTPCLYTRNAIQPVFTPLDIEMLTESFIASTLTTGKVSSHSSPALKDAGIFLHEFQPQLTLRHSFKRSSTQIQCLSVSESHIFAAQAEKAVIHVYSRETGNQETLVPFPERIHSLTYAGIGTALLVIGTEGGKLLLWELASGRISSSTPSHLQPVSSLVVASNRKFIVSGSADSNCHVWSVANLVSFTQPSTLSLNADTQRSPVRTFSNHRTGISALACAHSSTLTNFAVSASTDKTCYIWHIHTGKILRTILLPSTPLCFAIDPADRAIYAGYEDGNIQMIDLYHDPSSQSLNSIYNPKTTNPLQLLSESTWSNLTPEIGAAHSLTLSYDGTSLLSGHASGKIFAWDISKSRIRTTIADLAHPVTNLTMLRPDGLPSDRPAFEVRIVTKPRLELSLRSERGSIGIPASYTLNGQIKPQNTRRKPHSTAAEVKMTDFNHLLASPLFPDSLLADSIAELEHPAVTHQPSAPVESQSIRIAQLEDQVSSLTGTLSHYATAAERAQLTRIVRVTQREEVRLGKRTAYLDVKARGGDTGEAEDVMREWEERERALDKEAEELEEGEEGRGMDFDSAIAG